MTNMLPSAADRQSAYNVFVAAADAAIDADMVYRRAVAAVAAGLAEPAQATAAEEAYDKAAYAYFQASLAAGAPRFAERARIYAERRVIREAAAREGVRRE